MKHSVPHTVGQEMAQKVTRAALKSYAERFSEYQPRVTWQTEDQASVGFSVKGMSLSGQVKVRESTIDLEMDVPFLFKPFQKVAMSKIEEEIDGWMAKAKRGEIE